MVNTIGLRPASPGRPRNRTPDAARALLELRSARRLPRALRTAAGGARSSSSRPPASQHRSPLPRRNRPPARFFSQARPGHRRHGASLLPGRVYDGSHRRRLRRQPVHRQPPSANSVEEARRKAQQDGCLMKGRHERRHCEPAGWRAWPFDELRAVILPRLRDGTNGNPVGCGDMNRKSSRTSGRKRFVYPETRDRVRRTGARKAEVKGMP